MSTSSLSENLDVPLKKRKHMQVFLEKSCFENFTNIYNLDNCSKSRKKSLKNCQEEAHFYKFVAKDPRTFVNRKFH